MSKDNSKDVTRLKQYYREKVVPQLMEQFKYSNVMQVPKIVKITLNMGVGKAAEDRKIVKFAEEQLTKIAGQKAVITKARKSIAGFKIRDGWPIGCKVTLRKDQMYQFLDRLQNRRADLSTSSHIAMQAGWHS